MVKVKTVELEKELTDLKVSFLDWDNQRRLKVEVVLKSLNHNSTYVDVDQTTKRMAVVVSKNKHYKELEPAAQKMLNLHYTELARTKKERTEDRNRYARAEQKLKRFEEQGML